MTERTGPAPGNSLADPRNRPFAALIATLVLMAAGAALWIYLATPRSEVRATLPDFGAHEDVETKKRAFFEYLTPLIEVRNEEARKNHAFLEELAADLESGREPSRRELARLEVLARKHRTAPAEDDLAALVEALLFRVDALPPSLALAQAASESGWGTSRFAREGNNLFGEWCFTEGCGLVPAQRPPGTQHEVEVFPTPAAALDSWFLNLNAHPAYREVRALRAAAREAGRPLRGEELAGGLGRYSERGEDYVADIRAIIRGNDLGLLDLEGRPEARGIGSG